MVITRKEMHKILDIFEKFSSVDSIELTYEACAIGSTLDAAVETNIKDTYGRFTIPITTSEDW